MYLYVYNYFVPEPYCDQDCDERVLYGAAASNVGRALRDVFQQDGLLAQAIVKDAGISVRDVRMAPDNLKAYVLWDTYKGDVKMAEMILKRHTGKIKHLVSKRLKCKRAPFLEFIGYHETHVRMSEQHYDTLLQRLDDISSSSRQNSSVEREDSNSSMNDTT